MTRQRFHLPFVALLALVFAAGTEGFARADAAHPTVVELFQSQGCSDCPPANANVIALADRPDLLTLSFGVTYWDHLGWKDTFASPQFTNRQWDYARAFHRAEVFTPEVVVNGRADVVGSNSGELEALIRRESRAHDEPGITLENGRVRIDGGSGSVNAQVWLVRYDPNVVQVAIQAGENDGRTLPHKNVVKELVSLGTWSGRTETYPLPSPTRAGLRAAILLQSASGGAILAAARL